jgi:monovalent cation:proton antiporter-2 (CPA2) family protein
MHIETLDLREVMVFLFAAGIIVPLARRLGISPVFGFLVVGLAIGPHGFVHFADTLPWLRHVLITDLAGVRALAELGVVFLLFMIGIELSIDRLWAMRRRVFGLGGAQVLLTGAAIAVIATFFDNTLTTAVVLGGAFALSSTAIVMQLLTENRRLGTATGRTSFAILLCQDLAVVPILFLLGTFAKQTDASVLAAFGWAIGQAVFAVVTILAIGRLVIRPVFRFVGSTASREMFLALVLLVIIGTALLTEQVGLSMALGAFLAGLLFAETEYRHEIEVDIEPFKGLLLGLFFVSVGMSIDIAQVLAKPIWLIASVFGIFLVKSSIIFALARWSNESQAVALESGLLLGQAGEFAFVIIGIALGLGLLPNDTAQFMLILAGLTMVVTPPLAHVARNLARVIEDQEAIASQGDAAIPTELSDHIIIVGYGRVGQMLGALLDTQELTHVGIDIDPDLVASYRAAGSGVFYGDARQADMLGRLGVDNASALVVTMDNPHAAEQIVEIVRRHWPTLVIYARARDRGHAMRLINKGATHAIPETIEASLQLGEMILMGVGIPDQTARQIIQERRLLEQAAVDESKQR